MTITLPIEILKKLLIAFLENLVRMKLILNGFWDQCITQKTGNVFTSGKFKSWHSPLISWSQTSFYPHTPPWMGDHSFFLGWVIRGARLHCRKRKTSLYLCHLKDMRNKSYSIVHFTSHFGSLPTVSLKTAICH